ncbi:MAG TPA: hypothetical protein VH234_03910 [Candidatus Saccharimonadales bacterium]|jgi:hypothetical protein|nr:hypothetical protein [Candidatus Saccharimonadales bacterium]
MATKETSPNLVSEETFDTFIASKWPRLLGGLANQVRKGASEEEGFRLLWGALELAPAEEKNMMHELGVIEWDPRFNPNHYPPTLHITELGKQVVSAC